MVKTMITMDLDPDPVDAEEKNLDNFNYGKAFEEDGITYLEVYDICYARSETPDWIYEIFPHIDHISHAEITLSENLEQLWVHEFEWEEERDIHVALFIPESLKESDDRYGSESLEQDGLDAIAAVLAPLIEERADRPPVGTEKPARENLNHLLNKVNK